MTKRACLASAASWIRGIGFPRTLSPVAAIRSNIPSSGSECWQATEENPNEQYFAHYFGNKLSESVGGGRTISHPVGSKVK